MFHNLGLINKFVTGPLWRLLESAINILDINKRYKKMSSLFFDLSVDAKEFMLDNIIFFENVEISEDDVHDSLILSSNILDESTKQCLEVIFGSLCIVTRRILDDHLEDVKYSNPSHQLMKKTAGVSTTSTIVERNFGMLDRFIKKTNRNITYESIIMSRTNKTPEW